VLEPRGGRFGLAQDARSRFWPASLRSVAQPRRISSAKRSGNGDVLEPHRRGVDPVEIAPRSRRDPRPPPGGRARCDRRPARSVTAGGGCAASTPPTGVVLWCPAPTRSVFRVESPVAPHLEFVGHERRYEGDHHHTVLREPGQDRIGYVARVVHQGTRGRSARRSPAPSVTSRARRSWWPARHAEIHQHAEPVHLPHDFCRTR
jgi:hypothetical protein